MDASLTEGGLRSSPVLVRTNSFEDGLFEPNEGDPTEEEAKAVVTTAREALSQLTFAIEEEEDEATQAYSVVSQSGPMQARFLKTPASDLSSPSDYRPESERSTRSASSLSPVSLPQFTYAEAMLLNKIKDVVLSPQLRNTTLTSVYPYLMQHMHLFEEGLSNPATAGQTIEALKKIFQFNVQYQDGHIQIEEFGFIKDGKIAKLPRFRAVSDYNLRRPSPELSVAQVVDGYRKQMDIAYAKTAKFPLKTYHDVSTLFGFVKEHGHAAWGCIQDGCYARAEIVADYCRALSLPETNFCQAILMGEDMGMEDGEVVHLWNYHAAIAIETEDEEIWIIDPTSDVDSPQDIPSWIQQTCIHELEAVNIAISDYRAQDNSQPIPVDPAEKETFEVALLPPGMYFDMAEMHAIPLTAERRVKSSHQNTVGKRIEATREAKVAEKLLRYRALSPTLVDYLVGSYL